MSNVVAISVGGTGWGHGHCLALKSNKTVIAWGENSRGQATVPEGLINVIAISARSQHSLALLSDGRVVGWGDNRWGQLKIPPGVTNVAAIAAGEFSNLAITTNER